MARMRHDRDVRGLVFEPLWQWILSGEPSTDESERGHWSGMSYYLLWMGTMDWRCCGYCEHTPERAIRLIKLALEQGTVGLSDDERTMLDDANLKAVIAACDELEQPPTFEWWEKHYHECPARKEMLKQRHEAK
jgi:hypothetical protein